MNDEGERSKDEGREKAEEDGQSRKSGPSASIDIKSGPKFGVLTARLSPSASPGSNDDKIPIEKIINTANTMSSMLMAHKIALDDDFRLEPGMDISGPLMSLSPIMGSSPQATSSSPDAESNLQNRVKNIVRDAYWDLFREELESQQKEKLEEKKFDISKQLLSEIKQKIMDLLLPQHTRLREDLEDKLDSKIIDQLSQVDSLNLLEYAKYVVNLLSRLCAPIRDGKIKELNETEDIVQAYRGIMELLEMMRLDFANFALDRFKPHIKAHSQEYERVKFNEILDRQQSIGIDGLEYTKLWLSRAVERVDSVYGLDDLINSQDDLGNFKLDVDSDGHRPGSSDDSQVQVDAVNKILNSAYCELLEWSPDKQRLYPETLLFDEATFNQLGRQYKVLVLASSIILSTSAFVSCFKLNENNEFKVLIKSHIITLLTASYDDSIAPNLQKSPTSIDEILDAVKLETITAALVKDIKDKLGEKDEKLVQEFENNKELFTKQILDLQNSTNRVRELSRRRILEFVETLFSLDVEHQHKKFSSKDNPPINIPLGLSCLADEITLTMAQLVKITRYNRKVFFDHYQTIITELVKNRSKEKAR